MPILKRIIPLVILAGLSLILGLWAGALRLGWNLPFLGEMMPLGHGPFMVVGFLGTLIGLERAAAINRVWPFGVPIASGMAALALMVGLPVLVSVSLTTVASVLMVLVFISLYRQSPGAHFVIMAISAAAWLIGNVLWSRRGSLYSVAPWWVGFLVLMIAAERLQLTRVMQRSRRTLALFHLSAGVLLLGLVYSLLSFHMGLRLAGIGLSALALWLLRNDISWSSIRQSGLPRFMAVCLISGYVWLGISGLLWLFLAHDFHSGPRYDAMLHTVFLGFVFSMIFAHAPIIFPSITGMALPFRCAFYGHLLLLHLALSLRIVGDLMLWINAYRWGGTLNILAVVLFLGNNIYAARLGSHAGGKAVRGS